MLIRHLSGREFGGVVLDEAYSEDLKADIDEISLMAEFRIANRSDEGTPIMIASFDVDDYCLTRHARQTLAALSHLLEGRRPHIEQCEIAAYGFGDSPSATPIKTRRGNSSVIVFLNSEWGINDGGYLLVGTHGPALYETVFPRSGRLVHLPSDSEAFLCKPSRHSRKLLKTLHLDINYN